MKIEMGESLAISWLKHIKKCAIVQANWKPSFEWEEHDDAFVDQVMQDAHNYFFEVGYPVLPYERGYDRVDYYKVLMQTECDGIGIRVGRDRIPSEYFAIESAFHSDGLHYGRSNQDTATKVAEKMIRIPMALYYFMGVKRAHIYFATPKITNSFFGPVIEAFTHVSNFFLSDRFNQRGIHFEFELLINQPEETPGDFGSRFDDVVLNPVNKLLPIIDDTAELFVRAVSLDKMCMAHCDVSGSSLRRALKMLQIKFEEFSRRCETFTGISQMIEALHDNNGNLRKAIIDYVSEMKWDELHLQRKLNKRDIDRFARDEVAAKEVQHRRPGLDVNGPPDEQHVGDGNPLARGMVFTVRYGEFTMHFDSMIDVVYWVVNRYVVDHPDAGIERIRATFRPQRMFKALADAQREANWQRQYPREPIACANNEQLVVNRNWYNKPNGNWPRFLASAGAAGFIIR